MKWCGGLLSSDNLVNVVCVSFDSQTSDLELFRFQEKIMLDKVGRKRKILATDPSADYCQKYFRYVASFLFQWACLLKSWLTCFTSPTFKRLLWQLQPLCGAQLVSQLRELKITSFLMLLQLTSWQRLPHKHTFTETLLKASLSLFTLKQRSVDWNNLHWIILQFFRWILCCLCIL